MADRTIEIVIRGKNISDEAFDEVKAALGDIGDVAEKTSAAMDYALGQIAVDALYKVSEAASQAFKNMVGSAIESEAELAQLDAVLRSTGGAAGITRDAATDLAGELARLTLFEDDVVLSAENMLLTFTSISKDVFPDATKIVLDMSQALGQDLKNSAIQVGKALNDPITGVTALRRVGVQFNDAQQEMINKMVESGDLMGAQKMILQELQTEFGGSAEAAADTFGGALSQLNKEWGELQETIGSAMTQNETFKGLIESLTDLIRGLGEAFTNMPEGVQVGIISIIGLAAVLGKIAPVLISLKVLLGGAGLGGAFVALKGVLITVGGALATVTAPVWLLIAAIVALIATIVVFGEDAKNSFTMIAQIVGASLKRAGYELKQFGSNAISWASGLLSNLVAWFKRIGTGIVEGIRSGISSAWEGLKTEVGSALDNLLKTIQDKLSMHSPSLVFAKQVGMPMAQGIGLGFQQAMQSQVAPVMSRSLLPGGMMGATSNVTSVGTIHINNPLSIGERNWVRSNQEMVAERTVLRALKGRA